jgi:hypothetical protein
MVDWAQGELVPVNVYAVIPTLLVLIVAGDQVPVIPSEDINGNVGGLLLRHNGPIGLKFGVRFGLTKISIVKIEAHSEISGVNVYIVVPEVVVFMIFGDQVPVIGGVLLELFGNGGGIIPWQRVDIGVKEGSISGVIVIDIVVVIAHWLASGVNVYTNVPAVEVLITAGFHVPVMGEVLLLDVGSIGAALLIQIGPNGAKVGVASALTITFIVVGTVHPLLPSGVKV